jgi:hypothetical protein
MLGDARSRGWVDDRQGAVRGHVQRRAAAPAPVENGEQA